VHKSVDGGETWRWLREGFPPPEEYSFSAPIGALTIDPQDPETVYAGIGRPRWGDSGKGAVYRTRDGGAHWQLANPGGGGMDPQAIIGDLLVHPGVEGRLYAATDRGLYRSDDAGATWRRLDRGLPGAQVGRLALCRDHPEVMYLTLRNPPGHRPWEGGVFRSDDGGESWRAASQGLPRQIGRADEAGEMTSTPDRLVVHPSNPDIAYVGDASWVSAGVYRTVDGGRSWRRMTDPEGPNMQYGWITSWGPSVEGLALDPHRPETLFFTTSGHVFRTTDAGEHWQQAYTRRVPGPTGADAWWASTGLETTCLNDIVVHPRDPTHLYLCYFDIGLLQSRDGGRSFSQTVKGMHYTGNTFTVAFDPDDPNMMYAGTGEWASNHGDVCRSRDGGLTWEVVGKPEAGLPDGQTRHIIVDADSNPAARRIYVTVAESGVFCSEDGGNTWHARNQGLPGKSVRGMVQEAGGSKALLALIADEASDGGGIYRSEDRGLHWRRISTDLAWPDPYAFAISRSDPKRLYLAARAHWSREHGAAPGGVFASRDGGVSWQRVLDDRFMDALAVDPKDADVVYAGGTDHPYHDNAIGRGVLRSRDGGRTWEDLSMPNLPSRNITVLTLDPHSPGRLYVGTGGNGAFVREERPSP
jgi:photosystem II stability/assembly factor-like uncharacterized protein